MDDDDEEWIFDRLMSYGLDKIVGSDFDVRFFLGLSFKGFLSVLCRDVEGKSVGMIV